MEEKFGVLARISISDKLDYKCQTKIQESNKFLDYGEKLNWNKFFRLSFNNIGGKIKYLTLTERNKVNSEMQKPLNQK